jgi:hypothetical protein
MLQVGFSAIFVKTLMLDLEPNPPLKKSYGIFVFLVFYFIRIFVNFENFCVSFCVRRRKRVSRTPCIESSDVDLKVWFDDLEVAGGHSGVGDSP